jgi:transferase family protein
MHSRRKKVWQSPAQHGYRGLTLSGNVIAVLKEGFERALSQARHLVGTIERQKDGDHAFVKRKDSAVQFVVQYLDSPSMDAIKEKHFLSSALGDIDALSNLPMTYGEKAEAHPDNSPPVSSFKANFIPGGLIFNMHAHHYANDISGWGSFTELLAECCDAVVNEKTPPDMHPMCINHSRFTIPLGPIESQITAPPQKQRNPSHRPTQALLFHLRKSKAAALKKTASPQDGTWISTYDALCAFTWRVFSRIRQFIFDRDLDENLIWAEAVNMRRRLAPPHVHPRTQGNLCYPALSTTAGLPQPTVSDVVSEWPLWHLARYIRAMTESVTEDSLMATLAAIAPIANKCDLSVKVDSFPSMTMFVTDWREADVCTSTFGFGTPLAYRLLFDRFVEGLVIVYPAREGPAGHDEGVEVQVSFEEELVGMLVGDKEWNEYFEFRGLDPQGQV